MIELLITPTGKSYSPRAEWQHMSERPERRVFETKQEARAWLKERYGRAKRVPMYRDQKEGAPVIVGYVIGYRNADWSHAPVQHWLQQDWIEFRETQPVSP